LPANASSTPPDLDHDDAGSGGPVAHATDGLDRPSAELRADVAALRDDKAAQRAFVLAHLDRLAPRYNPTPKLKWWYEQGNAGSGHYTPGRGFHKGSRATCLPCWEARLREYTARGADMRGVA
jgi:hypothetical protein